MSQPIRQPVHANDSVRGQTGRNRQLSYTQERAPGRAQVDTGQPREPK